MKTAKNRFGELITKWESHVHPDNKNFMQVVKYLHVQRPDGRNSLYWRLENAAPNDKHVITNISLSDAVAKFTDEPDEGITEEMFQKWLANRK